MTIEQEIAFLDKLCAHTQERRMIALASGCGWVAPTDWESVQYNAAEHDPERPADKQIRRWYKAVNQTRPSEYAECTLQVVTEMWWYEMGRLECLRDVQKASKRRHYAYGEHPNPNQIDLWSAPQVRG